jgi:hypothetical protein
VARLAGCGRGVIGHWLRLRATGVALCRLRGGMSGGVVRWLGVRRVRAVLCGFGFRRARRLGQSWFPCRRWVRLSPWIGTRAPFWAAGFTAVGRRPGSAAGHSTPSHFSPSPGPGVWLRRRIAGRRPSGAAPALLPPWLRHTDASRISAARPTQDTQIHTPGPATSSPASVAGRPQNEQAELLRGLRPVRRRRRGFNVR